METDPKCRKIALICRDIEYYVEVNEVSNTPYFDLTKELETALRCNNTLQQINYLCKAVNRIVLIDNKVACQLEMDVLSKIFAFLSEVIDDETNSSEAPEVLVQGADYGKTKKTIHAKLLKLALDIIGIESQKGKRYAKRTISALRIYQLLAMNYQIPGCEDVFLKAICSKDIEEQAIGFVGLEKYYCVTKKEISYALIERLDEIFGKTNDRNLAYSCLQMKIQAGQIDKPNAVIRLADWNKKHH